MAAKKKPVVMPQAKNLTPPSATGIPGKAKAGGAAGKRAVKSVKRGKPDVSVGKGKNGMYW